MQSFDNPDFQIKLIILVVHCNHQMNVVPDISILVEIVFMRQKSHLLQNNNRY